MAEVTLAGEDHRRAEAIASCDDLVITHATAWLKDRSRASLDSRFDTISEGEERVRGEHATLRFIPSLARRHTLLFFCCSKRQTQRNAKGAQKLPVHLRGGG